MLTSQGQKILDDIYYKFRDEFIDSHPGCNENDIERGFLYVVYYGVTDAFMPDEMRADIEKIC